MAKVDLNGPNLNSEKFDNDRPKSIKTNQNGQDWPALALADQDRQKATKTDQDRPKSAKAYKVYEDRS